MSPGYPGVYAAGPESILCAELLTEKTPLSQASEVSPELAKLVEEDAYIILDQVTKRGDESSQELRHWFTQLQQQQGSGRQISVLEHVTLTYILRSKFLEGSPEAALAGEIESVLVRSWRELTGKDRAGASLLERLPRRVLRRESHEVRQFHAAAFQNLPPARASKETALGKDFSPRLRDVLVPSALVLAVGFSQTGAEALAGTLVGLSVATMVEHSIHRFVSHARRSADRLYDKAGWVGERLKGARFSHGEVHHKKTFKVYNRQFLSEREKAELDALLTEYGSLGRTIKASDYGRSLGLAGIVGGTLVTLPITTAVLAVAHAGAVVAGVDPGLVFYGTAVPASLSYMALSRYVHPYLHMSKEEAFSKAGPVMRRLLETRYAAMISRLHYGHHKGRGGNFNLLFGADALLGQLRKPTIRELTIMRKLGLFY